MDQPEGSRSMPAMAWATVSTPWSCTPSGAVILRMLSRGQRIWVKPSRRHSAARRSNCGMARTSPARPTSPITAPSWLYKGMLRQLGLEPKFYRSEAKDQLQNEIRRIRANDKKKIVCVLDEAHLLDKETLEEFRFLLNFEFDSTSPMALILVGQTELWAEKLRLQRYAAIRQRIDVNCVIPHLDRAETERYVRSHLEYAEGPTEIFTMKALDVIARESAGIPRVINRICEKSLMYAFQLQRKLVDDYMVNFVLEHEIAH